MFFVAITQGNKNQMVEMYFSNSGKLYFSRSLISVNVVSLIFASFTFSRFWLSLTFPAVPLSFYPDDPHLVHIVSGPLIGHHLPLIGHHNPNPTNPSPRLSGRPAAVLTNSAA